MRIHFIGIGGTAIGPLSLIAHQMGHQVSGSDKQNSQYIEYLKKHGVDQIFIGNDEANIAKLHDSQPIDWVVHTSAIDFENPNHPEIMFAKDHQIKVTKRDELLSKIITDSKQKLVAIAGTHGKTTTTAMAIWLFKELGLPVSYSVGAKIPFGDMGAFNPKADYFIYECDEFDRNFLAFKPYVSLITGVDYDHHEIYKSREEYVEAFQQFIDQSTANVVWQSDLDKNHFKLDDDDLILDDGDITLNELSIVGLVNRRNALQVMLGLSRLIGRPIGDFIDIMERFPGLSRRFEKLVEGLYTDYAHTPPKVAGALQLAKEVSDNVVVVYEPLTNRRQHFVKDEYRTLFGGIKKLYWVPSYLAREDPDQHILTPAELIENLDNKQVAEPAELDDKLKSNIDKHLKNGDLVICMSGGGGNSLDEWLRANFTNIN
jgi:UDP-N-acetylmuramate--alanine ligase